MDPVAEMDHLRQTCSTTLADFIAVARQIELDMQPLTVPVGVAAAERFSAQCAVVDEACEKYLSASMRFREFLKRHLYIIH